MDSPMASPNRVNKSAQFEILTRTRSKEFNTIVKDQYINSSKKFDTLDNEKATRESKRYKLPSRNRTCVPKKNLNELKNQYDNFKPYRINTSRLLSKNYIDVLQDLLIAI